MSVTTVHTNPDGIRMALPSDVLDISRRVQEGDPTYGWTGDERMYVAFDYKNKKYVVMRACEDGRDRFILSRSPEEFDARVLKYLAEHDSRVHDVLARIDKHNEMVDRQREAEVAEIERQLNKDVQWMARKLYLPGTDPAPYRG